jgi:hypothetical protein
MDVVFRAQDVTGGVLPDSALLHVPNRAHVVQKHGRAMTISTARSRFLVSMAVLAVSALGCRARTSPDPESTMLSVQNRSEFQVNDFAVPSAPSARIRLGSVGPLGTQTLELPTTAIAVDGALKVMVEPIGSTSVWTSPIVTVSADTRPCLRVQSDATGNLGLSTLYTQVGDGTACQ